MPRWPHESRQPLDPSLTDEPLANLRWLATVLLAVLSGLLATAVLLRVAELVGPPTESLRVTPVGLTVAGANWVTALLMPSWLIGYGRERIVADGESPRRLMPTRERLAELLAVVQVLALLLLGGAALFLTVAYLIEGRWWVAAFAVAGLGLLAQHRSRAAEVDAWLDEQVRLVERERQGFRDAELDDW